MRWLLDHTFQTATSNHNQICYWKQYSKVDVFTYIICTPYPFHTYRRGKIKQYSTVMTGNVLIFSSERCSEEVEDTVFTNIRLNLSWALGKCYSISFHLTSSDEMKCSQCLQIELIPHLHSSVMSTSRFHVLVSSMIHLPFPWISASTYKMTQKMRWLLVHRLKTTTTNHNQICYWKQYSKVDVVTYIICIP